MAGNVSGQNPNIANETAYKGIEKKTVYASADTNRGENEKTSTIDTQEAQAQYGSIFENAKSGDTDIINKKIGTSLLSDVKGDVARAAVNKYLGGTTIGKMINNWAGFGDITYNTVEVSDGEFADGEQAKIDANIKSAVESKVQQYTASITTQFEAALEHAIQQAENEIKGDLQADAEKFGANGKKGLTKEQFANIEYKRTSEEYGAEGDERNTNIATFNSSQLDTEDASKTKGYTTTVAFLEANGAKAQEKVVNGTKQTIYKVKIDGETQYVSVDDAGQVHTMDRDKGFLRSSKYTTDDSIADAKWQANNDGVDGNDFTGAKNVDVKVRKVDGQNQSVLTWEDSKGNEHSRVIDHNEVTGLTSSSDVHQVNAPGTRAKYASESSGLGTWVAADDAGKDVRQFNDDKHMIQNEVKINADGETKTTSFVRTNKERMRLDLANIDQAIQNIAKQAEDANGTVIKENNTTKITINGHTYELDTKDPQAADRTIRLIENELQFGGGATPEVVQPDLGKSYVINPKFNDNRLDTNLASSHENDSWAKGGTGNVENVGVQSPQKPTPNSKGIVKINYNSNGFSRTDFANEGWAASPNRAEEAKVIKEMDSLKGDGEKSVRNLQNSEQFATRLLQALDKSCKTPADVANKYNVSKLADALETANPSIFDNDGSMFKNCDFNRINLPEADKLKRYLKEQA